MLCIHWDGECLLCDWLASVTGHYHYSGSMWEVMENRFCKFPVLLPFCYLSLALLYCLNFLSFLSLALPGWVELGRPIHSLQVFPLFSNGYQHCCVVLSFPSISTRVCSDGRGKGIAFSRGTTLSATFIIQALKWGLQPASSPTVELARAVVGAELCLWQLFLSFPLFCLSCSFQTAHLQMSRYVDLSGVFVYWAGDSLISYSCLICCKCKGINKGIFLLCHDTDIILIFSLTLTSKT